MATDGKFYSESKTELGDAQAIIKAVMALDGAEVMCRNEEGVPQIISVPDGRELRSTKRLLDEFLERPPRKKGFSRHDRLQSFIEHVNRHKAPASVVFVSQEESKIAMIAVYDYHEPKAGAPAWLEHAAVYYLEHSPEWATWREAANTPMDQRAFAEFLEDRMTDLLEKGAAGESLKKFAQQLGAELASPAQILTLSRGLHVKVGRTVSAHQNLSTGEAQITFEESHTDKEGGALRVPTAFAIAIPVFVGGALYQIPVRLRYRIERSNVMWRVELHRDDLALRHALEEAASEVKKATELPVFWGRPELSTAEK